MLTIYHNPRCSKSRQTLQLIEERGVPVEVVLYLKETPDVDTLTEVLKKLGQPVQSMLRPKEETFKNLGLSLEDTRSDRDWLTLVHENPILLERPIVVSTEKAIIGRPPENVLSLID